MTAATGAALERLGRLVRYPDDHRPDDLEACAREIAGLDPAASAAFRAFADQVGALSAAERQEAYTRTFDLNPVCALEVGWHLYGEQYERGAFMVRMRAMLRRAGVEENGELPDHLSHLLPLAARLDADEARALVAESLEPALAKMRASLDRTATPYAALVGAIQRVLAVHACAQPEVHHA